MRPSRFTIVVIVLGLAAWVGIRQAWQLRELHQSVRQLTEQMEAVRSEAEASDSRLDALRLEGEAQRQERDETNARLAALARQLSVEDTDPRWHLPPATLPDWNADSPYVWVAKELLPKFPVQPFDSNGQLDPKVAQVLAAEPEQVAALNQTLSRLVTEFRTHEAAHAKPTEEHLPGIAQRDGDKRTITVEPIPEISARLREQFETAVREQFGRQRGELLLNTARGWVQEQFGWTSDQPGAPPPEPRTISVVRNPNGTFNISIRSGHVEMSVGGPNTLDDYLPAHLRHFFAGLEQEPDTP